jgi:hypothetical protein
MAKRLNVVGQEANRHRVIRNGISDLSQFAPSPFAHQGLQTRRPPPGLGFGNPGPPSGPRYNSVGPPAGLNGVFSNGRGKLSGRGGGSMRGGHRSGVARPSVDMDDPNWNPGDKRHLAYDRNAILDRRPSRGRSNGVSRGGYHPAPHPVASRPLAINSSAILDYGPSSTPALANRAATGSSVRPLKPVQAGTMRTSRYAPEDYVAAPLPPHLPNRTGVLSASTKASENLKLSSPNSNKERSRPGSSAGAKRAPKPPVSNTKSNLVDEKRFLGSASKHFLLSKSSGTSNGLHPPSPVSATSQSLSVVSSSREIGGSEFSTTQTIASTRQGNEGSKSHFI